MAVFLNNARFLSFPVKVIHTFTCTFTNTCKHGNTTVLLGNVVNQLLNKNGFTNTGTTKESDFSTFKVGASKSITLIPVSRISVDVTIHRKLVLFANWFYAPSSARCFQFNGITKNVKDTSKGIFTIRNADWTTSVQNF